MFSLIAKITFDNIQTIIMQKTVTLLLFIITTVAYAQFKGEASVVEKPANDKLNSFYLTNQSPLRPQHLVKLPVGAIEPKGWLLKSLELQREGLTGQLGEISIWLTKKNNAWLNKEGTGDWGWEEMPYWLKGYANIGYVLSDKKNDRRSDGLDRGYVEQPAR